MSERTVYEVHKGETHRVRLASPLTSTFTATATATLHALPGGVNSYSPATATAETYTVASWAGDATYGPGFDFTLSAAETDAMEPGYYIAAPKVSYTSPETFVDVPLAWIVIIKPYPS